MTKDAYYFPHFCNARHDRKIKRITKQLGVEGYGIYFMLLEVLREQSDYRYPVSDIDLLADEFGTSDVKVNAIIRNYDLFKIDELDMFFSENLIKNMEPYLKIKEQRSIAGKASAEKRRLLMLNGSSTVVEQRKVKESKQSKEEESSNSTPTRILGIDYRPAYEDTTDEFKKLYDEKFYSSLLSINAYLDENCKYLRQWDNQITIAEYKKIYDRIGKKEITIAQVKQAMSDLDGSRAAKDRYNSVYHGFNSFIKTILNKQYV